MAERVVCVFLSNQDVGHEQSSDGGEGQAHPGGPGQGGSGIAQVGIAACLGHVVHGGVGRGNGIGQVCVFGRVAFSQHETALLLNVHKANCRVTANTHNQCPLLKV